MQQCFYQVYGLRFIEFGFTGNPENFITDDRGIEIHRYAELLKQLCQTTLRLLRGAVKSESVMIITADVVAMPPRRGLDDRISTDFGPSLSIRGCTATCSSVMGLSSPVFSEHETKAQRLIAVMKIPSAAFIIKDFYRKTPSSCLRPHRHIQAHSRSGYARNPRPGNTPCLWFRPFRKPRGSYNRSPICCLR